MSRKHQAFPHRATFPRILCTSEFVCFSPWCHFISLLWGVLLSSKAPLSTVNTDLPHQNLRHMFNNRSLFHVTLTPHFRGQLLLKRQGPVTSPDVCLASAQLWDTRADWLVITSGVPSVPRCFVFQSKQQRLTSILIRAEKAAV